MRLPDLSRLAVSPTGALDDVLTEIADERADQQQRAAEERWERRARAFARTLDERDRVERERRQRMGDASERFTEDEVGLVLDAISKRHEKDPLRACQAIKNWCSLNRTHRNGCRNNAELWERVRVRLFPTPLSDVYDVPRYLADGSVDHANEPRLNFLAMCHAYKLVDAVTKRAYESLLRQAHDFFLSFRRGPRDHAFENANGILTLFPLVGSMAPFIQDAKLMAMKSPGYGQLYRLYSGNLRSPAGLFFRIYEQLFASTYWMLFHQDGLQKYFILLPAKEDPPGVDTGSAKVVCARLRAIAEVVGTYSVSIWGLLNGRIAHYAQTWDRQLIEQTYAEYLHNFQEAVVRAVFPSLLSQSGHRVYDFFPGMNPDVGGNNFSQMLFRRMYAIMHLARPTAETEAIFTSDEDEENDPLPVGPQADHY